MTLYDDLGVDEDASEEEIKRAFRNGAKQHHPDAGGNAERFGALVRAYEVLSDEEARARYDRTGEAEKPNIEAMAENLIGQVLNEIFAQIDAQEKPKIHANVIDAVRSHIERLRFLARDECRKQELTKARWKRQAPRFKGKIAEQMIAERIKRAGQGSAASQERIAMTEEALRILESYSHETDPDEPEARRFVHATIASTGTF